MINSEPITVSINSEPITVEIVSAPINIEVSGARGATGATGAAGNSGTMNVLGSDYANTNPNVAYSAWNFTVTNTKKYRVEITGAYTTTSNTHRAKITLFVPSLAIASAHVQMRLNLTGSSGGALTSYQNFVAGVFSIDSGSSTQTAGLSLPFTAVFYFTSTATGTVNVTLGTTLAASGPNVTYKACTSIIIQEF